MPSHKMVDITHCIKFSCLGNQAPDICVSLHDFKKQDQHFIYFGPGILAFFDQEDKLFPVGCYVLAVGLFWNNHDSSPVMILFTTYGSLPVYSRNSDFGFFICNCESELRLLSPF